MMVPRRELLWRVMLEAVQNHGPEVLVVDEISSEEVRGLMGGWMGLWM